MKFAGTLALTMMASFGLPHAALAGADLPPQEIAKYENLEEMKRKAAAEEAARKAAEEAEKQAEKEGEEPEKPVIATEGEFDENILNIQERLAVIGYYPTYKVDGIANKLMKKAIKRFQKDYGLKVNGIFNTETATALNYYTGTQHVMPISHYKTVY